MRITVDLRYLKPPKDNANAKYRRRVTSPAMRAMLGVKVIEWSLGTKDPAKFFAAYNAAHARFEALETKADTTTVAQVEWSIAHAAAVKHGLAKPTDSKIGPVDAMKEGGRFDAFTAAALTEADALTPAQMKAPFASKPPKTPFELLAKAQHRGIERPAILLHTAVESYLKDRQRRSTYRDLEKQVWLAVRGLEEAIGRVNPALVDLTTDDAYAYRDSLTERGNSIATVKRRVSSLHAPLRSAAKRFNMLGWINPFSELVMPDDDGVAGEAKRLSLTLDDIRKMTPAMCRMNEDARDIWHLMLFTGAGPNEIRGVQWQEVDLAHATPFIEIKPNGRRRLKTGERPRKLPLVGTALAMMKARAAQRRPGDGNVFPRYGKHPDARSLSAVLVKGMKAGGVWQKIVKVPYSARHALKDRMRRVAPQFIQLLLFGHGFKSEGAAASGYGEDQLLDMQAEHLANALTKWGISDYPAAFQKADASRPIPLDGP